MFLDNSLDVAKQLTPKLIDEQAAKIRESVKIYGECKVSLKFNFKIVASKIQLDYAISFVESKVNAGDKIYIDEAQMPMFDE